MTMRMFAKIASVSLVGLGLVSQASATAPGHVWSKAFGSATNDEGYSVATDANGNVYLTGFFSGSTSFGGPNLTCPTFSNGCVFLAKFAPDGTPQWSKSFNNDYGSGNAVATDAFGNVFLAGAFADADFGCGTGTLSGSIFAVKLAPDGSCLWSKPFRSVATAGTGNAGGNDVINGLAIDTGGNVILAGKFGCATNDGCAINFGGGLIASPQQFSYGGIFVAKLSGTNGSWVWSKAYGGVSGQDFATGVAVDTTGNAFVTGYFSTSSLNLGGSNLTNAGSSDFFLAKYRGTDGAPLWSKGIGGPSNDFGWGVAVDSSGAAVITGQFEGTVNFGGTSLTSASQYQDIFLARYAGADGSPLWAKRFGNISADCGRAIATDAIGHIVLTGCFTGTVDFGNGSPLSSNAGGIDIFVAQYNAADGSTVWAKDLGGPSTDLSLGLAVDSGGNTLITGYFQGAVDFGGGPISGGGGLDIFLAKYGSGGGAPPPKPVITSALTATGTVNTAFSYQITATNSPTSYGASGLPAGLSVNTTGLISGTPTTTVGSPFSVTISAMNAGGTGSATLILTIGAAAPPPKPVITSALTATGTVNTAFSYQITATNSPTSYGASGLPAGLSVNTTGLISGTPTTTVGSPFSVTISAMNAGGTGSATLILTIGAAAPPPKPVITSALTATGTVNTAFSYQITATNSPTSYGASGLPAGLSVNTTGLISGTPTTTVGSPFSVTISAMNAGGTGSATLILTIGAAAPPPKPVITSALTATGTVNTAFSYQITATNSPTSYGASGLPAGLSVNTTGLISGTPTTTVGSPFSVTISAMNAGGTGTATLRLTINAPPPAPVITSSLTITGTVGAAFSYQITATNSPSSYGATGLPAGLSINPSSGLISGTPTTSGTSSVTISATNSGGMGTATLKLHRH